MDYCRYCANNEDPVETAKQLTVEDGAYICKKHRGQLNRAWKRGEIDRGRGGSVPRLRFVWAWNGFNFAQARKLVLASYGVLSITEIKKFSYEDIALFMDWCENRRRSMFDAYKPKPNTA